MFEIFGFIKAIANPVQAITTGIIEWQNKKLVATTDAERIQADENIQILRMRQQVMVAEAGQSRLNIVVRAGLALPVVFLLAKIFIYDKALGQWTQGHTDALDDNLWKIVMAVLGFYLLDNLRKAYAAKK